MPPDRSPQTEPAEPPPLVLHAEGRRGREVAACCRRARRLGVRPGLPLAEVHLNAPRALLAEHDPAADQAALEDLAAALQRRVSPRVGLADPGPGAPCGLAADVTGCAHLFGGERELVAAAIGAARDEGFAARAAVAGTVGAAWALARFGPDRAAVLDPAGGDDRLHALPAAALRLPPKVLETLRGLGVTTVGAVRRLPRSALPSRFGPDVLRRLDQCVGGRDEPVEPVRPPAPVVAVRDLDHPVAGRAAIGRLCGELLGEALARLPAGRGVRELAFEFLPERDARGRSGEPHVLPLATARPTREADRLAALLTLQLDRARLAPPRRVTLTVTAHERLRVASEALFDADGADAARELDRLVEVLAGRLGGDRVCVAEPTGDPLPELALRLRPAAGGAVAAVPRPAGWTAGTRPAALLDPPEPVRVLSSVPDGPPYRLARRGRPAVAVAGAWGPERIQTGWWRGPRADRDYWRAELEGGELVWLFRDLKTGRWCLHGVFT